MRMMILLSCRLNNRIGLQAFELNGSRHMVGANYFYRRCRETRCFATFQNRKEERRAKVGKPKAQDRGDGIYANIYKVEYGSAKSGLPSSQEFKVLGIESSCDDTGAAVVRSDGVILGEALASQGDIHEEFGGIVPGLARDAHVAKIDMIIKESLNKADCTIDDIDAIGVTVGPGLEICLRVGCNAARELAIKYKKPFVGVHHLEAHILMARLENKELMFPFMALLVSGGHCQILKCIDIGKYEFIGGTLDDSLGEAYDKTARMLGLKVGGGGGPAVEALAKSGDANAVKLPVPMQSRPDCDFSYAGLKNAVRMACNKLKKEGNLDELNDIDKANIAASFQNVAIKHIEQRLKRAMKECEPSIKSLAVVGGVAANQELRSRIQKICDDQEWSLAIPPPRLCTDQGTMSAWAAIERIKVGSTDDPMLQDVFARYPFAGDDIM